MGYEFFVGYVSSWVNRMPRIENKHLRKYFQFYMFNKLIKLIVILGVFYQTIAYSKSASFNEFNSRDLSNYFSGIIAFENNDNSDALKFFNASKVLLNKHDAYLKRYTFSLVLENKVAQAINVIKNNSNDENLDFFEAYLLLIADNLKKNNLNQAEKLLISEMPIIPIYTYVKAYQISSDVKGWYPNIIDTHHPKFIYLER